MRRRTILTSAAVAVGLVLLGALGFGPIVRGRVSSFASAHRLDIDVGAVRAGWFAITLRDLHIRPRGVSGSVTLREVRVGLSPWLTPTGVEAHGGEVLAEGSIDELASALSAWRGTERRDQGERRRLPFALDGLSFRWSEQAGREPGVELRGASVARSDEGWRAAFESAVGRRQQLEVEVTGASAGLDTKGELAAVRVASARVSWTREEHNGAEPAPPSTEPQPPALPLYGARKPSPGTTSTLTVHLPFPELRAIRARLVVAGSIARAHVADGTRVDVDALSFALVEGANRLAIGHGPLAIVRTGDSVDVTFTTGATADGASVALSARFPLGATDATVSLAGGPVSLAALGVDEGAAGLVEVDRTTVTGRSRVSLAATGDALTFDGEFSARALAVREPRIASEVVRGIDATVIARGVLDDKGALRLDDGEVTLGALHLVGRGQVEQTADHLAASVAFELPATGCQALLQSIPSALIPTLEDAQVSGTLGARGRLAFDSRSLDDLVLEQEVDDRCTMAVVPVSLAKERFSEPFEHTIYMPDGTLEEETTGPTTENWSDLDHISPFVQVAVLTTEDGAFYKHRGFNRAAMRNALVANLKAGRFARGASTVTMQLAKNLFLSRDKTLARKLEEVILADYLEQTFTKREMMELYLNVIEFGPGVYGITQAAAHYFARRPDELNLAESLFLASILPSPVRFHKLAEKPQLSEAWMKHVRALMVIADKLGTISDEELAVGLKEEVTFHAPTDPAPPPRTSVRGTHFQAETDGAGEWTETP